MGLTNVPVAESLGVEEQDLRAVQKARRRGRWLGPFLRGGLVILGAVLGLLVAAAHYPPPSSSYPYIPSGGLTAGAISASLGSRRSWIVSILVSVLAFAYMVLLVAWISSGGVETGVTLYGVFQGGTRASCLGGSMSRVWLHRTGGHERGTLQ